MCSVFCFNFFCLFQWYSMNEMEFSCFFFTYLALFTKYTKSLLEKEKKQNKKDLTKRVVFAV